MKKYTTLVLLLNLFLSHSQESLHEYNKFTNDELNFTEYQEDKTAEAIVFFDQGEIKFIENSSNQSVARITRTTRIKILKQDGISWGSVKIPLYTPNSDRDEVLISVKGQSINIDPDTGGIIRSTLNTRDVFDQDYKDSDSYTLKVFTLPNVSVGTIIEYEYEVETPYLSILPVWEFQSSIPTLYSSLELNIVPYYEYQFIAQGIEKFDVEEKYNSKRKKNMFGNEFTEIVYTLGMKNIPAFKNEKYISSKEDYIMSLKLQLATIHYPDGRNQNYSTTWDKLVEEFYDMKKFGTFIKQSKKFAKELQKTRPELSSNNNVEQIKNLNEFVKSEFVLSGSNRAISNKEFKDFIKEKSGNSAAHNLFFIGLLQGYGLDAIPVLSSTRSHGKINPKYPFLDNFNYSLVYVRSDINQIYDATSHYLPYDMIPSYTINGIGLVAENPAQWIKLNDSHVSLKMHNIILFPNINEGLFQERITSNYTGYMGNYYRNSFDLKDENELIELFEDSFEKEGIKDIKVKALEDPEAPLIINLIAESDLTELGGLIEINPFAGFEERNNFLTETSRNYPVDFNFQRATVLNSTIIIPQGYQVSNNLESTNFDNELLNYSRNFVLKGNQLKIEFKYHFKQSLYQPENYQALKMHYDRIIEFSKESIILVKKDPLNGL